LIPSWVPQTGINGTKQRFLTEWLEQEIDGAPAPDLCLHYLIVVRSDEDDGNPPSLGR
jgi:hypothetical protein